MIPEEIKEGQRTTWKLTAPGWMKHDRVISEGARPVSERLLRLVGISEGHRLLDIASGTGEPALTAAEWVGPPNFAHVLADAPQLPFADAAVPVLLSMETIEWVDAPATVLGEMARVASKRILLVQSDWQSLWGDSGDPETSREFTRLFAGPQ